MNLLVVEDDTASREEMCRALRRHGHSVDAAHSGRQALERYRNSDLVVLSLDIDDLDGLELCRDIRATCEIPVIALAARASEPDRVLGLRAGADDYMARPCGTHELAARVEAVTRRTGSRPRGDRAISHGLLRIDPDAREVRWKQRLINVTRKEFDLLHLLASKPKTVFSRQEIMSEVWEEEYRKTSRTLDTHVNSLRSKLHDSNSIVTVRGIGFRLGHESATAE
ncbi:response regulator transcription factor [Actinopolyspora erythraea]|nr:response regulator transcription factor [Actinopolyspora erythraea]